LHKGIAYRASDPEICFKATEMTSYSPTTTLLSTSLTRADKVLNGTITSWFVVAIVGQLFFAAYVAAFYGGAVVQGNLADWNEVLTPGYQEGHTFSNLAIGIHLFFAVLIMLGGPLQFIGRIRKQFPAFHRWNGRTYVMLTTIAGLSGFYMLMSDEAAGGPVSRPAMSLEALLIVLAGTLVWRFAVKRKMKQHEAWAVRLFLVASGVWFFRVFLMGWLVINGGPVGFDPETFTGPFLDFLSYAHYLLPLAVYELYLLAKRHGGVGGRYAMAGLMVGCILVTAIGVFGATMGLWLPRL
jgi:hypothetical protein